MAAYRRASAPRHQTNRMGAIEMGAPAGSLDTVEAMSGMTLWRDFDDQPHIVLSPSAQESSVDAVIGGSTDVAPVVALDNDLVECGHGAQLRCADFQGTGHLSLRQRPHFDDRAGCIVVPDEQRLAWAGPSPQRRGEACANAGRSATRSKTPTAAATACSKGVTCLAGAASARWIGATGNSMTAPRPVLFR